ncbi:hypothetical protein BGZ80_000281 [Entomortierella chlamydospora]|uniref:Dilute domain-containing protein n=1 Tax=Entomortierella chlamydospora TaxID=101097 RepID=A0A9P6MSL2_9FUNG|nr:hypothetical protein BGZ79_009405 [Entomortierella chlamydospora]KAG0011995.1 hypothetical protein BGZ80_000281 [Entomortierella chlamydospora]
MDPVNVADMAAPNPHMHRLSQLSTSTMDDDFISDLHRLSISGFDSPSSNVSEYDAFIIEDSYSKKTESKDLSSDLWTDQEDHYNSQDGEGDFLNSSIEQAPVQSPIANSADSSRGKVDRSFRDVEQLVVNQSPEVVNPIPSSLQSQYSFTFDREQLDGPRGIIQRAISDEEKKAKISMLLSRAASNGDLNRITEILDNFRDWVDINTHEEDGSTPLIYAACFGQTAAVRMLLDAGALADERDKFGWTALVWATNNKHEAIVRLLLDHGASPTVQTTKGRTVADFLRHDPNDTTRIAQIFQEPFMRSSFAERSFIRANSSTLGPLQFHQELMTESDRQNQLNTDSSQNPTSNNTLRNDGSLLDQLQVEEEEEEEEEEEGDSEFDWNRCKYDQMFVFSSKDIPRIIKTVITTKDHVRSGPHKPIPAYVIFLAARFAHNFGTPELLEELIDAVVAAIQSVTKNKPDDMGLIAYWISNTSTLAHFLRKDAGLSPTSETYQGKFESLVLSMVKLIVLDAERRIEQIIETAMLEHDTITGLDEVRFQSDWAFSFWKGRAGKNNRKNRRASAPPTLPEQLLLPGSLSRLSLQVQRPISPRQIIISPRTVTTMLSSVLYVMQTNDVHPQIIHYVIAQLLYYISSEVFNRMMNNRKFLCRSKALQVRLNISILEDWLRNNKLPSRLANQIAPLVQLLQLLQVLSQQNDLTMWIETRKKVELLNSVHIEHVVSLYRYEVNEQRLPAEVTKYVMQVAADTAKVKRQSMEKKTEFNPVSEPETPSRRNSSQGSSVRGSSEFEADEEDEMDETITVDSRSGASAQASIKQTVVTDEEDVTPSSMTKNSKSWIHFVMPINLAARDGGVERMFFPEIPEEIMTLLDST